MKTTPGLHYFNPAPHSSEEVTVDVCVYGGVSGGVIAAIEASRRGLNVILLEQSAHLGGMTTGGLGMTDIGNKAAIGGMAREFYQRVGAKYGRDIEWCFEPHVAEAVFEEWLQETSVRVLRRQFVESVDMHQSAIRSLRTVSGLVVHAKIFIDCSYEGDLLAHAGVSFHVGREDNSVYGETLNGAQIREKHQFEGLVDPYVVPGSPASGLLPGIESSSFTQGEGDSRVQAYNFRMCLTQREDIRVPFPKPENYRPEWYILLKRHLNTGWNEAFQKFDPICNGKTDTNNHGAVSTDYIGQNFAYPMASYLDREKIFQAHVNYQQGIMWCLANDPEIPAAIHEPMSTWGLCADEFIDCGHWSQALYIREARRMVSDYVMTEAHCCHRIEAPESVGLAAYGMDSHNCRRVVIDGHVMNEGDVQVGVTKPYPLPYRSIVPRRNECTNLFVTFCLSASHIAFGSIRMEPVFMVLSQSAAIAAAIAIEGKLPVQDVPYEVLRPELLARQQILKPVESN